MWRESAPSTAPPHVVRWSKGRPVRGWRDSKTRSPYRPDSGMPTLRGASTIKSRAAPTTVTSDSLDTAADLERRQREGLSDLTVADPVAGDDSLSGHPVTYSGVRHRSMVSHAAVLPCGCAGLYLLCGAWAPGVQQPRRQHRGAGC